MLFWHVKIPAIALLGLTAAPAVAAEDSTFRVRPDAEAVLDQYCYSCHEEGTTKGDVQLDNLQSQPLEARLDLLNLVQEKVFLGEMPPKKKKQPGEDDKKTLLDWITGELRAHNASKFEEKLRMPDYGNAVDHDKLFSGKYKDLPGFTNDRRWLISEFIFDTKFNKLLECNAQRDIDGTRRSIIGDKGRNVNLTNPFLLPTNSGVRYYDTTTLDGGHLLTMITNAKEASEYMLTLAKRKTYLPAITSIMEPEWAHERILADRETYLKANIEKLLEEIYQGRNQDMLPVFNARTYTAPPEAAGPGGKPLKKPVFDTAAPGREELDQIWATMRRHSAGSNDVDTLIRKCERDWFIYGVNERSVQLRVNFMHNYMDDLVKRMPKPNRVAANPPPASEMAVFRAAILKHRKPGDHYTAIIAKCMSGWEEEFKQERLKAGTMNDQSIGNLVDQLFTRIIERAPTAEEKAKYCALTKSYSRQLGNKETITKIIQTLILRTDFVYRQEFGTGSPDGQGRRMLSPHDASFALAYALTDSSPDKQLAEAAASGRLNTREDYRREVQRMLKARDQYYVIDDAVEKSGADSFTNMPIRKLRFFREFFGYPAMMPIFKDNKRFGGDYVNSAGRIVSEADMLVEHILEQDRNVFETLLTTEDFYVYHSGDNESMAASSKLVRDIYEYFKDKNWQDFDNERLKTYVPFLREHPIMGVNVDTIGADKGRQDSLRSFKSTMASYTERLGKGQTAAAPFPAYPSHGKSEAQTRTGKQLRGMEVAKCFNIDLANWNYPVTQPAKVEHRKGILTHPAWLIAFAANTATDPVRRGKWVRQKLLAGTVPDTPVTVDAVIPEDHHQTLRGRLAKVTEVEYCWKCHERMNPLGYAFEMYDDFGRYRMEEFLEHPDNLIKKMPDKGSPQADLRDIYKTLPVDAKGRLAGTDDPNLDGDVTDAIDLAGRLAKSTKVRQSIIRHAFRYFMGRNEGLADSKTLIDADEAYVKSGGSFDAVIVSLLTSDSFIYRKPVTY